MKHKNLLFLLTTLTLSSCITPSVSSTPSESEPLSTSESLSSSEVKESTEESSSSAESNQESSSSEDSSTPDSSTPDSSPVEEEKDTFTRATDYLGSDGDVYRINIKTNDGEFPLDKESYVKGNINITEQDTSKVIKEDMPMGIKLRGNSTMSADKKPFKVKFDSKQSLFGLEKAKEWVLLANYYDKSNLRNYLAYQTAHKLDNLGFNPSHIMIDVYFNDEYYGLFTLCEQMEVNPGRVDIEDNFNKDGVSSFFLEADERAKDEYKGFQGKCYVSSGGYDFALKGPDADDYGEALEDFNSDDEEKRAEAQEVLNQFDKDTAWLQTFMDNVSAAVESADYTQYSKVIDVDSFIDYYLVQEFFKNVDVGSTSQNYVIDQADKKVKLKMGPVWDFDIGAGVVDETSSSTYAYYANTNLFMRSRDYYINDLFNDPYFEKLVKERYTEVREEVFLAVFDELDLAVEALKDAQNRNITRWPIPAERKTWIEVYAISERYNSIDTLQGHYTLLENFLTERLHVMDKAYLLK